VFRGVIVCLVAALQAGLVAGRCASAGDRPNIVWIIVEDMSADFGC